MTAVAPTPQPAEKTARLSSGQRRGLRIAGYGAAIILPFTPLAFSLMDGTYGETAHLNAQATATVDRLIPPVSPDKFEQAQQTEVDFARRAVESGFPSGGNTLFSLPKGYGKNSYASSSSRYIARTGKRSQWSFRKRRKKCCFESCRASSIHDRGCRLYVFQSQKAK